MIVGKMRAIKIGGYCQGKRVIQESLVQLFPGSFCEAGWWCIGGEFETSQTHFWEQLSVDAVLITSDTRYIGHIIVGLVRLAPRALIIELTALLAGPGGASEADVID